MGKKSDRAVKVHFMGVGGSGISAIARMAKEMGYEVTGCDLEEGPVTTRLRREGIPVEIGHSARHLTGIDLLVHSPAIFYQSQNHPEYVKAKKRGLTLTWEEFMAKKLVKGKEVVAVAGTHGKGTTTAMLAWVLTYAGLDPTVEIGANLLDWGKKNFRVGEGKYFVLEADEFREKFLLFHPGILVITSIEMDHPEYFKNLDEVLRAFVKLVRGMVKPKTLVVNGEDEGILKLLKGLRRYKWNGKVIRYKKLTKSQVKLKLPGQHVRSDAAAVVALAKKLGLKWPVVKKALESFSGLERRFELRGESKGVLVYDDYAHHPTAIRVNIVAAREKYPGRKVWVVFQPHMYARLKILFGEFAKALSLANRVVVTDVYTRREHGVTKPSGKDLALAVGPMATYVGGELTNVANFVERNTEKGDVVLVMGAGDVYRVSDLLLQNR